MDYAEFSKMVDVFMESGFNYFDTAHGYVGGKSEIALRECLTSRYPRDSYTPPETGKPPTASSAASVNTPVLSI